MGAARKRKTRPKPSPTQAHPGRIPAAATVAIFGQAIGSSYMPARGTGVRQQILKSQPKAKSNSGKWFSQQYSSASISAGQTCAGAAAACSDHGLPPADISRIAKAAAGSHKLRSRKNFKKRQPDHRLLLGTTLSRTIRGTVALSREARGPRWAALKGGP